MNFRRIKCFRAFGWVDWLLLAALLASFALSMFTVYHTSLNLLDSDASSELLLAEHLHETGRSVLSEDWFYSSELRMLYTQLVFAPLFGLLHSWRQVRFVGTVLLQLMLMAGYAYCMCKAKLGRRPLLAGLALLLLPVSVTYGQIVLYQTYYVPHLTIGFFTIGLFLAIEQDFRMKKAAGWKGFHLALYAGLTFAGGLGGFRQLAITQAPLMLSALLLLGKQEKPLQNRKGQALAGLALLGCLMALAGLMINQAWHAVYTFDNYSDVQLTVLGYDLISDTVFGILHQFGFRRDVALLSVMGVLGMASLLGAGLCIHGCMRTLQESAEEYPVGESIIRHMMPCAWCVSLLLVLFTTENNFSLRYMVPFSVWFIPYLTLEATSLRGKRFLYQAVVVCVCVVCALNGLVNHRSFQHPEDFGQMYEGLSVRTPNTVALLTPLRDRIVAEGYDLGYATHWQCNVLTEMTNGEVDMVNLEDRDEKLCYYDWLTPKSLRSRESEQAFALLTAYEARLADQAPLNAILQLEMNHCDNYFLYRIVDLPAWRAYLAGEAAAELQTTFSNGHAQ